MKAKLREDRCEAAGPNETWAMDFVHDQLATGRKIRILTVVDTFTRYSPVIDPRFTYRSENVVEALDRACATLGYPKAIRVDQGTEFVSRNLDLWAYAHGVTLDFSRPGKPTDNAFIEASSTGASAPKLPERPPVRHLRTRSACKEGFGAITTRFAPCKQSASIAPIKVINPGDAIQSSSNRNRKLSSEFEEWL